MFKNKKVLVTGSEGMIGKELVIMLNELGCQNITHFDIKFKADVTSSDCVEMIFNNYGPFDYCFHLFGIKGNPKMTKEKPIDFMGPMLRGDTNIILACQKHNVKRFLYTSSIAVEHPEEDKYPSWAKQTAEKLIEAMRIQYPNGTKYTIVRPANVYGRFDNFNTENPMVITSLVKKALSDPILEVWGDGSQIRDFINAKDVARGMIQAMESGETKPLNLCNNKGITIKQVAQIISKETGKEIKWNKSKPTGSKSRVMKLNWDFKPKIEIEEGIKEVIKCNKK